MNSTSVQSLDDVVESLRELRIHAGNPSFSDVALAVNKLRLSRGMNEFEARTARSTVYAVFQKGRRRLDAQLVAEVFVALGGEVDQARELARAVGRLQQGDHTAHLAIASVEAPQFGPLIGRHQEISLLLDLPEGSAASVCALGGMGKSHLAYAVAAQWVADGLADTVVVVGLRGNDAELPPVTPAAAQVALLRALGCSSSPSEAQARQALLGQTLADARAVVVLDDAADAEQAAGVLPTDLGAARVLITSRMRIDIPGCAVMVLPPLTESEALEFLESDLPDGTVDGDPIAARSLVESTGGIPLALGLLKVRLADSLEWSLADHAKRAARQAKQLRLESPVAAAIESTYSRLEPVAQHALRYLAAQPLPSVDALGAAALWGLEADDAVSVAAHLEATNLLQVRGGRLNLHDVVRAYALDRGLDEDPASERTAAIDRLTDHLVEQAWAAHAGLHVGEGCRYGDRESSVTPLEGAEARARLADDGENLLTIAATLEGRRPDVVLEISGALHSWLYDTGRHSDAVWLHGRAVALADPRDLLAVGRARVGLGAALSVLHDFDVAGEHLEAALAAARETGDVGLHIASLNSLGGNDAMAGQLESAARRMDELLALARDVGWTYSETTTLSNLSNCYLGLGRYDEAAVLLREALVIAHREGYVLIEVTNRAVLAQLLAEMGRCDEAVDAADEALAAAARLAASDGGIAYAKYPQGLARIGRAVAYAGLDRPALAIADLTEACEIAESIGSVELLDEIEKARALIAEG